MGNDLLLQRTGYPRSMRFSAFPAATQHIVLVVCISCCASTFRSQSDNSKQSGIAYDKPASGHFVPVDGDSLVYMIPYVQPRPTRFAFVVVVGTTHPTKSDPPFDWRRTKMLGAILILNFRIVLGGTRRIHLEWLGSEWSVRSSR